MISNPRIPVSFIKDQRGRNYPVHTDFSKVGSQSCNRLVKRLSMGYFYGSAQAFKNPRGALSDDLMHEHLKRQTKWIQAAQRAFDAGDMESVALCLREQSVSGCLARDSANAWLQNRARTWTDKGDFHNLTAVGAL